MREPMNPGAQSPIGESLLWSRILRPGAAGTVVVGVQGEVDALTAPRLAVTLTEQLATATLLVVDLSQVDFFGAAGLGVLVSAAARAAERAVTLRLVAGTRVRRVLSLVGLEEKLTVCATVAAALAHPHTSYCGSPDPE
ncbi:STAS domain-containing protein [Amycolatopsis pigmentata]|uniref:Anti-sigma factor antagonist n=1 Tax=Amycolatopsis pigmentata TaxID=450801 RepID=A0ABW5FVQ0_9PSEU